MLWQYCHKSILRHWRLSSYSHYRNFISKNIISRQYCHKRILLTVIVLEEQNTNHAIWISGGVHIPKIYIRGQHSISVFVLLRNNFKIMMLLYITQLCQYYYHFYKKNKEYETLMYHCCDSSPTHVKHFLF